MTLNTKYSEGEQKSRWSLHDQRKNSQGKIATPYCLCHDAWRPVHHTMHEEWSMMQHVENVPWQNAWSIVHNRTSQWLLSSHIRIMVWLHQWKINNLKPSLELTSLSNYPAWTTDNSSTINNVTDSTNPKYSLIIHSVDVTDISNMMLPMKLIVCPHPIFL